jgi:hypothetical protein
LFSFDGSPCLPFHENFMPLHTSWWPFSDFPLIIMKIPFMLGVWFWKKGKWWGKRCFFSSDLPSEAWGREAWDGQRAEDLVKIVNLNCPIITVFWDEKKKRRKRWNGIERGLSFRVMHFDDWLLLPNIGVDGRTNKNSRFYPPCACALSSFFCSKYFLCVIWE